MTPRTRLPGTRGPVWARALVIAVLTLLVTGLVPSLPGGGGPEPAGASDVCGQPNLVLLEPVQVTDQCQGTGDLFCGLIACPGASSGDTSRLDDAHLIGFSMYGWVTPFPGGYADTRFPLKIVTNLGTAQLPIQGLTFTAMTTGPCVVLRGPDTSGNLVYELHGSTSCTLTVSASYHGDTVTQSSLFHVAQQPTPLSFGTQLPTVGRPGEQYLISGVAGERLDAPTMTATGACTMWQTQYPYPASVVQLGPGGGVCTLTSTIGASQDYLAATITHQITVWAPQPQSVTWVPGRVPPAEVRYPSTTSVEIAADSSRNNVTFMSVTGPCSIELHVPEWVDGRGYVVQPATVHFTGTGTCRVSAQDFIPIPPAEPNPLVEDITILPDLPNVAPTAAFDDTLVGRAPAAQLSVDASRSTDSDGTLVGYRWDFGNGQTATGLRAGTTYTAPGTYTVRLDVTDDAGSTVSTSESVVVQAGDTDPPVISVPASPVMVEATSASGAVATFTATANDAVSGAVPMSCSAASGATFPLGDTVVSCTAADAAGNGASTSFTVRVVDTTAPVVASIGALQAEATSSAGAAVSFATPTAADAVSTVAASCSPPSGGTFPVGSTTITCSATDAAGLTGSSTGTVTVVDSTAPAWGTFPAAAAVDATTPSGAPVTYPAPTATDLVSTPAVSCDRASGSPFPVGTTTVTCAARDAAGNTATRTFTVTVRPYVAPYALLVSTAATRANPVGLQGATISGPVAILPKLPVETARRAVAVTYLVTGPNRTVELDLRLSSPFDLAGANRQGLANLKTFRSGQWTIQTTIVFSNFTATTSTTRFTVR